MTDRPDPAAIVADADVLAADLLLGGADREVIDLAWSHDWIRLVASEALLDDAAAVVARLADPGLAADWRDEATAMVDRVEQRPGDHPALASARAGNAAHVLTHDASLRTADAGMAIKSRVETSVKSPAAFLSLAEPAALYRAAVGGAYPGPDRPPRAEGTDSP